MRRRKTASSASVSLGSAACSAFFAPKSDFIAWSEPRRSDIPTPLIYRDQLYMATPAISSGMIIIRGLKDLFAIGQPTATKPSGR
jgi:hypothetical protein